MNQREQRDNSPMALERRVLALADDLEVRAEGDTPKKRIIGHAAVFDRWTTLYEGESLVWREIVRPGAFREAITARQDVAALFNHDSNYVLGRTTSGTLTLKEDPTGLLTDIDPPDTQTIRDLVLSPIARRDITQMSFAFQVRRDVETTTVGKEGVTVMDNGGERITRWFEGNQQHEDRELLSVDLFDISPVTYPAYKDTDVALRQRGAMYESEIRQSVLAGVQKLRKSWRLARMRMRLQLADARGKGGDS
jgi:HK97 family phage prohead protease